MAKRFDAPNNDEIAAWEERLKKEGLGSELPPDKAVEALREETGAKGDNLADKIHKKLQEYWQFRSGSRYGEHKQIAQAIAADLGISPEDVEVDESFIKAVEEEIAEAQRALKDVADKLNAGGTVHPKRLANTLRDRAYRDFPGVSEMVLDDIADKLAGGEN